MHELSSLQSKVYEMNNQEDGSSTKLLVILSLATLGLHLITSQGYGYFRDEFYYLACTDHLAAGYVDHPPFSILLLWLNRRILGDSLPTLRFLPAVAGALTVWFTGKMVRQLGGSLFAVLLAALCIMAVPSYMALDFFYSMNCFDVLFWTLGSYLFMRVLQQPSKANWLLLGIVLGLGLLNKISVLWFGAGIFAGLILTPARKQLLTPWPWIAGVIALIIFHPYIIWNLHNNFPTLEFMKNATQEKMAEVSFIDFVKGQLNEMNPFISPIWIIGLVFYFVLPKGRPFRASGWIYVTVFLILILNQKSRAGYLAPAYPILFAGGSTAIGDWINQFGLNWLKPVLVIVVIISGLIVAPFAIPFLPVEKYIAYAKFFGQAPSTEEKKEVGALPQFYADMNGWDAHVKEVVRIWNQLGTEDRKRCRIFAGNYGVAGAINFLGKPYGLPPVISNHNNYWLWGPGDFSGECLIMLGGTLERKKQFFENVEPVGQIDCGYCMPYENHKTVFIARKLKVAMQDWWNEIKNYN